MVVEWMHNSKAFVESMVVGSVVLQIVRIELHMVVMVNVLNMQ